MIQSFKSKSTKELWLTGKSKKLESTILRVALRKLWQIDNAVALEDLKAPPNNRLEPLKADREGQYSIRLNNRWRVCFIWDEGHAYEIEIVDYH
jgi:proteic killer suppression protein